MIRFTIDGNPCDLFAVPIVPGFDAESLCSVESGRSGRVMRIELAATGRNADLLLHPEDPHAFPAFNHTIHRGELRVDDALLFEGTVRLLATESGGEGAPYAVDVREGASGWAKAACLRLFHQIPIDYSRRLTPTMIRQSWTEDAPVRFFPVHRENFTLSYSSAGIEPARRLLSPDDYHPFLHVGSLVRAMVESEGYVLRSRFMEERLFASLYVSGAYPSREVQTLRERMDFLARRRSEASAAADHLGRVYASPFQTLNSVGNLVETATAGDTTDQGEVLADTFTRNGCFRIENRRIVFRPTATVNVAFEYRLRYRTQYRIRSRKWLEGFDSIYLDDGSDFEGRLTNRFADRRAEIRTGFQYRIVVFDHTEGDAYSLSCSVNGLAGVPVGTFSTRTALLTTPTAQSLSDPILYRRAAGETSYKPYPDDWALYDGSVEETGTTEAELAVRSAPVTVRPDAPKIFSRIYFYGASQGMTLELTRDCTVRPIFTEGPGLDSTVVFADLARHSLRQSLFWDALQQLFDLRIYTEEAARTVWIEPAQDFYDGSRQFDWTERVVGERPIRIVDLALETHQKRTLAYADSRTAEDGTVLGEWSYRSTCPAALEGEQTLRNPMFGTVTSQAGHYADAESALILQVDGAQSHNEDERNFPPCLVSYAGLHPLPEGERWGYPSGEAEYPLAAFRFAGDESMPGCNLCFEDRDGVQGLHRFYDRRFLRETFRQRITLTIRLEPYEFCQLFSPGGSTPDVRSIFLFELQGERIRCMLHRIDGYDALNRTAQCAFDRLVQD